jgi:DNA-binding ferritin-like protein
MLKNNSLNSNNSAAGKMVLFMFELQLGTKMFHWQTSSYANHKATDKLLGKLADLTDSFLEKYFGLFGRPVLRSGASVSVENMNKAKFLKLIGTADEYFRGPMEKLISKNSELMNIRDEMLAELDQTKYLLTLN